MKDDEFRPRSLLSIMPLIAALVLIVPLLVTAVVKLQSPQIEREAYANLEIKARLKAQQMESWLAERHGDGEAVAADAELIKHIAGIRRTGDSRRMALVRHRLQTLLQSYGYAAAYLLDPQGKVILTQGSAHQVSAQTKMLLPELFASGKVGQSDLYLDTLDGRVSLNFVVPLRRTVAGKPQAVAALVLHSEPDEFIFPQILAWPSTSASGETQLVKKQGDALVFINQLRHTKDSALKLTRPLTDPLLAAAAAIRAGQPGIVRGRDYRDIEVLAAYRPIAGTDWHLIDKLDHAEVMAPLWKLVAWICAMAFTAIFAIGLLLRHFWAQRERLQQLVSQELRAQALQESAARLRAVTETARDAIVTVDAAGKIADWNSSATRLFGFTPAEIIGQDLTQIIPARFHQRAMDSFRRMLNGDPDNKNGSIAELIGRRKDDSELLVERSVALWETDAGRFYTCTMRDITAQKRIEQKLRLHGAALEASANAIIITDQTGMIEWGNPAFSTLSGYSMDEALGRNPRELVNSGMQPTEIYQELWSTIQAGKVWRGELVNRRKDGTQYIEDQTITPLRDDDGIIRHFISVKQDITERKQREDHTRRLLVENETILSNALVGIVLLKQRRIASCNRRLEELFGYAPGELVGTSTEVLYDSRETFDKIGMTAYKIAAEGKNYSTEVKLRHKDGSIFWGALSGRAIDPAHPHEGSIWVYADISERRQAEQETNKLLQAVEQSPVSIIVTNRKGVIEYVNPSFTRITGYTRQDVTGQTPALLKTEHTPSAIHEDLWATILDGRIWHGTLRNRCKDGRLIWEQTSISPIFDEAGEITHFVAVKEDVTERTRIEQELEAHQAHLEDLVVQRTAELTTALEAARMADLAKDEFLANITHELRTPLAAVIGFSSLARPFSSDPLQREYLDKVNSAGKTLASIIDDLLDLSKIVAGRMAFEARPFSLRQLVLRSRSVLSYKALEKGLELRERINEEIPDVLVGDSLRVEQILLNLLSNAIKFTTAGWVELRVDLLAREERRVHLGIDVEDTGIGLREAEIGRLFKPFSQADASMTRKFGGTGLGLAICKHLAEMMDGDISVTGRADHGSIFHVRLWLAVAEANELPAMETEQHQAVQVRYEDVRVLVVDDQPFNRDVVKGLLAVVGVTPHLAEDGQQALDILASGAEHFDLVLMDVQMPIMDGLTATRAIRNLDGLAHLPIIAMTAHTMAHERENSVNAGMNDHIGKPFDEAGFYGMLAKWLPAGKQHRQDLAEPQPDATADFPSLAGVDTDAGLALLLGDEQRYRHWLSEFVVEAPAALTLVRQALTTSQPEPASMATHALKGRMGLLGMTQLHGIAAALEAAIDGAAPADELLSRLELGVAAMCAEIRSKLNPSKSPAPASEILSDTLPPGSPPASVTRLLASLLTCDSDCDVIAATCLNELKDTLWEPRLRQALIYTQNFDFAAAHAVLCPNLHAE